MDWRPMYASKSRRVLVDDDDALLAWELQDILSGHGYEVLGPISRLSILLRRQHFPIQVQASPIVSIATEPAESRVKERHSEFCIEFS